MVDKWLRENPGQDKFPNSKTTIFPSAGAQSYTDRRGESRKFTTLQKNELQRLQQEAMERASRRISPRAEENPTMREMKQAYDAMERAKKGARERFMRGGNNPYTDAEIKAQKRRQRPVQVEDKIGLFSDRGQ